MTRTGRARPSHYEVEVRDRAGAPGSAGRLPVTVHRAGAGSAALRFASLRTARITATGEPMRGKLPNFARFEDWSRFAREPLVWLGMDDPGLTRVAIEERDPMRERLTTLLAGWREAFGAAGSTVTKAIEAAEENAADPDAPGATAAVHPGLQDVVTAIAEERGRVNPRRLAEAPPDLLARLRADRRGRPDGRGARQRLGAPPRPPRAGPPTPLAGSLPA